ncbi:Gx transporter family protein [Clostridium hydrogeniformans]|uniref:Gx transporter family protein n=1 Tax=Clostridium hydrogeniformans TaxID=349933 RepID=UPI00048698C6|nr:Gx transporter family protein [Clostridium hydrogeniformans]
MKKINKMVLIGLLVAQALVLHIFESNIPIPLLTPGAKLGLANLVTVLSLYILNKKETFFIIISRLLLGAMFGGSLSALMYSASGAILSFIMMVVVKEGLKDKVSIIGVSASGAIFHNIGQILVACAIVRNIWVSLYLPILTVTGIATGIFIGLTCNLLVAHLNKISFMKQ